MQNDEPEPVVAKKAAAGEEDEVALFEVRAFMCECVEIIAT